MKAEKLIAWLLSIIGAVGISLGFLFSTFQTSADSNRANSAFDKRLDRIEGKIDDLLEKRN